MNIIITGGASGLGKILGESLLQNNNNVIIIDFISPESIEKNYLIKVNYYQFNLANVDSIPKLIDSIFNKFNRIDVLINNAAARNFNQFDKFSLREISEMINVNYIAPVVISRLVMEKMISFNFGRIINISSVSSFYGYSTGTLYCSTKSALNIFSEALAKEVIKSKKDITINVILPDSFKTREGQKLGNYDYIVNKIIFYVKLFINTKSNGKIKIVSPPIRRLIILLRFIIYRLYSYIK